MANTWFQFKQFTIHQQHAAMKVTTDACLFGAMLPQCLPSKGIRMLDIGTGTGLLSLMASQLNADAKITAVEIDNATAAEAVQNINNSPFSQNINVQQGDILTFFPEKKYHEIFCNPPFYENQLASPNQQKNIAHHSGGLTLEMLIPIIKKWLLPSGNVSLLIPHYREQEVLQLADSQKLFATLIFRVKQTSAHQPFRSILKFSQKKCHPHFEEITIRDTGNQYTPDFIRLLKPFYLNL
jgi:tRNA1Val (adenine37-N6)-methyltransferase